MKNQYFGDVYDYVKYGLIRRLTNYGKEPSALCWMMREDDGSSEGRIAGYLEDIAVRSFDPPVFDLLLAARDRMELDPRIIERSGLLPNVRFHSPIITDHADTRREYFRSFYKKVKGRELVCFDPDTGLQGNNSPTPGKQNSSKYLMRAEVHRAFERGHSPLVFVHQVTGNHETDEEFVARTLSNLHPVKNATYLIGFIHTRAGLILIPQAHRINEYAGIARQVHRDWPDLRITEERIA